MSKKKLVENQKNSPMTLSQFEEVLDRKLDQKFSGFAVIVKAGFDAVDERFDKVDMRFDSIDQEITGIKMRLGGLDRRMDDFSENYKRKKIQVKF
jgi:hypothetical protein